MSQWLDDHLELALVVVVLSILAALCAVVFAGIVLVNRDKGECLSAHQQTTIVPMVMGKTTMFVPTTSSVCDQWQYPDGVTQ